MKISDLEKHFMKKEKNEKLIGANKCIRFKIANRTKYAMHNYFW